jgi:hypothetical protein
VSRLLGHKSIQTTIDFYTSFETAAADRRFDQSVRMPLRRNGRSTHKRPHRD